MPLLAVSSGRAAASILHHFWKLSKRQLIPCAAPRSLSENSVAGPRASVFSPDKDGDLSAIALAKAEAGDVGFIVDTAGCRQAENKPLEARSNSPTGSLTGHLPALIMIVTQADSKKHGGKSVH